MKLPPVILISFSPYIMKWQRFIDWVCPELTVECIALPRNFFDAEPEWFPRHAESLLSRLVQKFDQILLNHERALALVTLHVDLPKGNKKDEKINRGNEWMPLREIHRIRWPYTIIAQLILMYPEIFWLFLHEDATHTSIEKNDSDINQPILYPYIHYIAMKQILRSPRHYFAERLRWACAITPWFDPSGLRQRIRATMWEHPDESGEKNVEAPIRKTFALAMDEETIYAYFHAYLLYRLGYCTWMITRWKVANRVLDKNAPLNFQIALEDHYLHFPDEPSDVHLSRLSERSQRLPKIDSIPLRVFITVGHHHNIEQWKEDQQHIERLRQIFSLKIPSPLIKPVAGMFELIRSGKLKRAQDFVWPISAKKLENEIEPTHSAPGMLVLMVESILRRAYTYIEKVNNLPQAIRIALLALEGKELLRGKTPTTTIECFSLQHEAEILAESMFYGIEYHLDLKSRFREIKKEVKTYVQWFASKARRRVSLNIQLSIIERLARRLQELNQFEEEIFARRNTRELQISLWIRRRPYRWIIWPIMKYLAFGLRSPLHLILLMTLWSILFTALIGYMYNFFDAGYNVFHVMILTMKLMFTLEFSPPLETGSGPHLVWVNWGLPTIVGMISWIHLGIFASHLYLILSRR